MTSHPPALQMSAHLFLSEASPHAMGGHRQCARGVDRHILLISSPMPQSLGIADSAGMPQAGDCRAAAPSWVIKIGGCICVSVLVLVGVPRATPGSQLGASGGVAASTCLSGRSACIALCGLLTGVCDAHWQAVEGGRNCPGRFPHIPGTEDTGGHFGGKRLSKSGSGGACI